MKAPLMLEDRTHAMRAYGRTRGVSPAALRSACPRPWVAELCADGSRRFLRGLTDYVDVVGARGPQIVFLLDAGPTYEACEPNPPDPPVRFRCQVRNGYVVRL